MAKGVCIKDAMRVTEPTGEELIPVSDNTNTPKCISVSTIVEMATHQPAYQNIEKNVQILMADASTQGSIRQIVSESINSVVGTNADTSDKNTVCGAKAYATELSEWNMFN